MKKGHTRRFNIKRTGLILSGNHMAHEIECGDVLIMRTKDDVIECKPGGLLSDKLLDVSYAIDRKDEKELVKKGRSIGIRAVIP